MLRRLFGFFVVVVVLLLLGLRGLDLVDGDEGRGEHSQSHHCQQQWHSLYGPIYIIIIIE